MELLLIHFIRSCKKQKIYNKVKIFFYNQKQNSNHNQKHKEVLRRNEKLHFFDSEAMEEALNPEVLSIQLEQKKISKPLNTIH